MTIDYAALARRIRAIVDLSPSYLDPDEAADLRTLELLLRGMAERAPVAHIQWQGTWMPMFMHPAPQPHPDPFPDEPEWEAPIEPTEAKIEAAAKEICQCHAEGCGVDPGDTWKVYYEQFRTEATRVLRAALAVKENQR